MFFGKFQKVVIGLLIHCIILYYFSVGGVSHRNKTQSLPLCLFVISFTIVCFIVGIFIIWANGTDKDKPTEKISNHEYYLFTTENSENSEIDEKLSTTR